MFCAKCGQKIESNSQFCGVCGERNNSYSKVSEEELMKAWIGEDNDKFLGSKVDKKSFFLVLLLQSSFFFYRKMYAYAIIWVVGNIIFLFYNPLFIIIFALYFAGTLNYCYKWCAKNAINKYRKKYPNIKDEELLAILKMHGGTNLAGAIIFGITNLIIMLLIIVLLI